MSDALTLNSDTTKGMRRSARARQMRSGRNTPNTDIFRPSVYNTPLSLTPISELNELIPETISGSKPTKTRTNTRKRKAPATDSPGASSTPAAKRPRRHNSQKQRQQQQQPRNSKSGSRAPSLSRTSSRYGRRKVDATNSSTTSETSHLLASPSSIEAKEILRRARETVHQLEIDLESESSSTQGRKPFLMDVILNSKAPNLANLEDLLTEALERELGRSFYTDGTDGLRYHEGPYMWRSSSTGESWDLSPRKIYHVSAERSTATWNPTLDGEDDCVVEDDGCEEARWNCAYAWSPRFSPRS